MVAQCWSYVSPLELLESNFESETDYIGVTRCKRLRLQSLKFKRWISSKLGIQGPRTVTKNDLQWLCQLFPRLILNFHGLENCFSAFKKYDSRVDALATEKNKKPIVPPHEVTISDLTIGFSVVDLVENEVWLVIFFFKRGFFQRLKSEKQGVL